MDTVKVLPLLAILLSLSAGSVLAQTGKIAGTVTDASSDEPLPGVNVVIDGTTIGAVTDVDGYYAILNVQPGTYRLRASFVGFTPKVIEGVEVNIDLTTEVDITMQEEAVGMDEVVVTAGRPIIQRDISASQRNIGAEEVQAGRFQSVNDLITAQVGVNAVSAYEDRPPIRGSSLEESKFLVDGIDQGDPLTNRPYYRVNLDAVQEVKMQTGGFSAEYGNVRSGVINVVTKEGGDTYSGSFNFQYSPAGVKHFGPMMFGHASPVAAPFVDPQLGAFSGFLMDESGDFLLDEEGEQIPNGFFQGWEAVAHESLKPGDPHYGDPMELYARWLWRHRSQDSIDELKRLEREGLVSIEWGEGVNPEREAFHEYGVQPDYRGSFTLGGPLPLLNRVKFFASYSTQQTEYGYRTADPAYNDQHARLKLTTNLASNLKLNLSGFYGSQDGVNGGEGPSLSGMVTSNPFGVLGGTNKLWYPHCTRPGHQLRQIYGARLTHTLSPKTFYEVKLTHSRTDYELIQDRRNTVPVQGTRFDGSLVAKGDRPQTNLNEGIIGTTAQAEERAAAGEYGWENWRDWAKIKIGDYWYDEAPKGHVPINWRDVTGYYRYGSCKTRINDSKSRQYEFATSLTSQVNRYNQVKVGVQLTYRDLYQFYEYVGASTNTGTVQTSDAHPWIGALFAQDKLEFKGLVANLGLRLDGILHGKFPVLDGAADDKVRGPYSDFLLPGNTDTLASVVPMQRVRQVRLSPRLGLSFPITTVAKIFLNYGHFYQWPQAEDVYRNVYDMAQGGRIDFYGNPRLAPPRTIAYEAGYEQNLFDRMNLRLTGYYKDINNESSSARFYPLGYGGRFYDMQRNMRFRDVRGLEAFLELRRGVFPFISGWTSVNYLVTSGGRFGFDRFYEDPSRQPRDVSTEVSNPDVRPIFKTSLNFHAPNDFGPNLGGVPLLGGLNINLLYTWQRGSQFTWNPDGIPYVEDNVRWRPYQRWDLRLSKDLFDAGRFSAMFYVDVTNLFNNRNMTRPDDGSVRGNFAWDGHKWWKNQFRSYMESLDLEVQQDGSIEGSDRPGDWKADYIDLPGFTPWLFLERREVFFGVKLYY